MFLNNSSSKSIHLSNISFPSISIKSSKEMISSPFKLSMNVWEYSDKFEIVSLNIFLFISFFSFSLLFLRSLSSLSNTLFI